MIGQASRQIDLAHVTPFRLGAVEIIPPTREIVGDRGRECLEPRVMQVLVVLAHAEGQVVTRDELIEQCWGGRIVGEDALIRAISKVRHLAELTNPPSWTIQTIKKVGYRLAPSGAGAGSVSGPRPRRDRIARNLAHRVAIPIAAAIVAVGAATWGWVATRPQPTSLSQVAVLEITSLASDPAAKALADAVKVRIIEGLNARGVQTLPERGARGRPGPRLSLTGRVELAGKQRRVTVGLTDTASRLSLWSDTFVETPGGAALPDQVAWRVADVVGFTGEVLGQDAVKMAPATLAAYLNAVEHIRLGDVGALTSRQLLGRVAREAPEFAAGRAMFAVSTAFQAQRASEPNASELRRQARAEALRALSIDPSQGQAYLALSLLEPRQNWAVRQSLLQKGIAVAMAAGPQRAFDTATLSNFQGMLLREVGRPSDAVALTKSAAELDPLAPTKLASHGSTLASAGRLTDADAVLGEAFSRWPTHTNVRSAVLGYALLYAPPVEGVRLLDRLQQTGSLAEAPHWRAYLDSLACGCGRAEAARRLAAAMDTEAVDPRLGIPALSRLGAVDDAYKALERALSRTPDLNLSFLFQPVARPLVSDGRFLELPAGRRLATYWAKTGQWPDYCRSGGQPSVCRPLAPAVASRGVAGG